MKYNTLQLLGCVELMSSVFFASYSSRDGAEVASKRPFKKFIELLRARVQSKTGIQGRAISFVDGENIKTGDDWTQALSDELRTAEVIVCLVSPNYLGSLWCGRELEIFDQRYQRWKATTNGSSSSRFILPVSWEVLPAALPPKLALHQFAEHEFPSSYLKKGLWYLATRTNDDDFIDVVELLSDRIKEAIVSAQRLPPHDLPIVDFNAIPSAFDDPPRPHNVVAIAMTPGGGAWRPNDNFPGLMELTQRVCGRLGVVVRFEDPAAHDVVQRIARAEREKQLVLCLSAVADDGAVDPRLASADLAAGCHLAFMFVDNVRNPAAQPRLIGSILDRFTGTAVSEAAADNRARISTPVLLENTLEVLLCQARAKLIATTEGVAVKDDSLERNAIDAGIPIQQRPGLTGPGGPAIV